MKRMILLAITGLILLLTLVAALAAPHSETPNDPRVNPDANACYNGGSMAGKCKLDDELWIAGWYEIRLEQGLISSDQIPDSYKWLLDAPQSTDELVPLSTPEVKPG